MGTGSIVCMGTWSIVCVVIGVVILAVAIILKKRSG